jgi:hypothetical protein
VHHDILAEDDRRLTDPSFAPPLATIAAGLLEQAFPKKPCPPDNAAKIDAAIRDGWRTVAQEVGMRYVEHALIAGKLPLLDWSMIEGEVDLGPEILEALSSAKTDEKLPDDVWKALSATKIDHATVVPSDVESALRSNGISLPRKHRDR